MLKKIRLKNFKLHEDTTIEASRITVFIGPNNSGKSSIFQALLALKSASRRGGDDRLIPPHGRQVARPAVEFVLAGPELRPVLRPAEEQPFLYAELPDPIIDLGDEYGDVLRDPLQQLQIGADAELPTPSSASVLARTFGAFQLNFELSFNENRLVRHTGSVACAFGQTPTWDWTPAKAHQSYSVTLPIPRYGAELSVNLGERLGSPFYCNVQFKQPPPGEDISALNTEMPGLTDLWRRFLDSLRFIHQLRGFEEWGYPTTSSPAHESLDRLVLTDRAVALANLLAANARLRTEISDRLKSLVGVGIEFETASAHRVKVWATAEKTGRPETLFVNEGSGANQLPFILVPIALAKPGETILMSEPEAHLHPKAQSALTGMLLEISRKAELQLFIETHSEHVLHRLLHAVAKGELARDDLTIWYFPEPKEGKADPEHLKIDEQGGVEGGLPGFFDQSLDELTEYLEALKQPKK